MGFRIGAFDIVEPGIAAGQRLFHILPGNIAAGIHRRGDAPRFQHFQHMPHKFRLEQTFAAGESHTAIGSVKIQVRQHFLQKSVRGEHFSHPLQSTGGTLIHIFQLPDTAAAAAGDAVFPKKLDLGFRPQSFRIMAPAATQRAAFHKHCGTDPRAVMDREPLDIKDNAFQYSPSPYP